MLKFRERKYLEQGEYYALFIITALSMSFRMCKLVAYDILNAILK